MLKPEKNGFYSVKHVQAANACTLILTKSRQTITVKSGAFGSRASVGGFPVIDGAGRSAENGAGFVAQNHVRGILQTENETIDAGLPFAYFRAERRKKVSKRKCKREKSV